MKEYKDEPFTVSNCKLFCVGCREEICVKKSSIENHLNRQNTEKKKICESNVKSVLQNPWRSIIKLIIIVIIINSWYNSEVHPKGDMLPHSQQIFHVKVMQTFLRAGVALNKIGSFRNLLEESGYRLCDRRYMYDLLPFIVN